MAKVTEIEAVGYCDSTDMASEHSIIIVKKNRLFDIKGSYKATKAYQLELTPIDLDELNRLYCVIGYQPLSIDEILKHYKKEKVLPQKKEKRLGVYTEDWTSTYITRADIESNKGKTLIYFVLDDFIKLPATKKELETIALLDNRNKMQGLNNITVKDNILQVLQQYKVESRMYNCTNDAICFSNKVGFNKLVKDAIEYYLNNTVLKDLGCKIVVPKQTSNRCYNYYDPLCYVGDIQLQCNKEE